MKHLLILAGLGLLLSGCADTGQTKATSTRSRDPQSVIGKTWQWVGTVTPVETIDVKQPERYTLYFAETGRLEARFDCNSGGGRYEISEGKLSFGPLMATRMACPEDSLDYVFTKHLNDVDSFFVDGDSLYLELPADSGTLQFRRQSNGD
ncbi:META domain-containing protein [Methylomonas sp. MgM2]